MRDEYNLFIDYFNDNDEEYPAFSNLSKNYRALTIKGDESYKIK